jgi:hypothetical protein
MMGTKSEVVWASTPCRFVGRYRPIGERSLRLYGGSTTFTCVLETDAADSSETFVITYKIKRYFNLENHKSQK